MTRTNIILDHYYFIQLLYTFFIKGIEGLLFGLISNYIKNKNYKPILENIMLMIACVTSCFIMMLGYFLTETFLYGSYQTALVSIYSNLVQSVLSIIIFYVLYNILKNIKLFKRKDL
ncbi:MAG: ECF transporter S component [Bacilli bacterium]|nr:ECF transporter S component [Bacilli bacterium]